MKKLLLIPTLTFILTVMCNHAISQNYLWAQNAGGPGASIGQSCSSDASGNIIATGYFTGSIALGTTVLTNADTGNTFDIFIVKYDPSGNVLWAKSAGGTRDDRGNSVTADAAGNIIVTGSFASDSITFGATTLTNADTGNTFDIFIVKYDPSGNVLWAKSAGGNWYDAGNSVTADASGNIIVTGAFGSDSVTFGTTVLTNITTSGSSDLFIVKYDGSGNMLWAQRAGGIDEDRGSGIVTDMSGNLFMIGWFQSSSINFGTTTLNNTTVPLPDIFIVKYNASGTTLWAAQSAGNAVVSSVCTDVNGNAYMLGQFGPSVTFGTTTLTNPDWSNNDNEDVFIVKYNSSGNLSWAGSVGGPSDEHGSGVSTDASGNLFVTGYFSSPAITIGTTTLTNTSLLADLFVSKYDPAGNILWAESDSGTSGDYTSSVSTGVGGSVFITGYSQSPSVTFGTITLTNSVGADMFIAKLDGMTGIAENNRENGVSIFPNPFSTQTVLQTNIPLHNASLTVDNCFGQTVAQIKNLSGQTIVFNRDNLASGLYFVRLTADNKVFVDKLIITDK